MPFLLQVQLFFSDRAFPTTVSYRKETTVSYRKDMRAIQLDIAPEEICHNMATELALVGNGKAIVGRFNKVSPAVSCSIRHPWRQLA
jgi:hypothetical protein